MPINTCARRAAAALACTAALAATPAAHATTITFGGLAGTDGASFASYSEAGYTVSNLLGSWSQSLGAGQAAPSLRGKISKSLLFGLGVDTLLVTSGGNDFTFGSIDIAATGGAIGYALIGIDDGTPTFYQTGLLPQLASFVTLAGTHTQAIDTLAIVIGGVKGTVFGIDNIVITAVPEPAALAGMGLGTACLLWLTRRRPGVPGAAMPAAA